MQNIFRRAIEFNPTVYGHTPLLDIFRYDFWGTPLDSSKSHHSWRPLTTLSFRLQLKDLFNLHLVNVGIHAVNVLLFRQLIRQSWKMAKIWQNFWFWRNFLLLPKIWISDGILIFGQKIGFLYYSMIFDENFDFLPHFWWKFLFFGKNLYFWLKFSFLTKILIFDFFVKNWDFRFVCQKLGFSIFGHNFFFCYFFIFHQNLYFREKYEISWKFFDKNFITIISIAMKIK